MIASNKRAMPISAEPAASEYRSKSACSYRSRKPRNISSGFQTPSLRGILQQLVLTLRCRFDQLQALRPPLRL